MIARRLLLSGLLAGAALASPALAQDSGAPQASAQVDDIVVTAQKREQSLQDVPISVKAFGEEALEALGAQSIGDLDTFTPGLSIDDTSVTQPKFAIRGVSTDDFGVGTDPSVGIFVDGVYWLISDRLC